MNKDFITLTLEKIPGIISWILILSPLWAAFLFPKQYGIFLLLFIVFLVVKSIKNLFYFLINYNRVLKDSRIDWVHKSRNFVDYAKLLHIVIIPFAKEGIEVLEPTVKAIANQSRGEEKIAVCLTSEAKFPEGDKISKYLAEKYQNNIDYIWTTAHTLQVGEIVGKSANMLNGARYVEAKIQELNIDENFVTLTSCDCDSIFPQNYFSMLSYKFLVNEDERYSIFWAGALAFIANFWSLPYYSRILASHFTYNNISMLGREYLRFVQISTYSASYKLFKKIDFYSPDVIPEDFHTFFKALYKYGSNVRCAPLYLLIYSDAAEGVGYWKSFVNQYKQVQRWAYGVSDFPYLFKNTYKYILKTDKGIYDKLYVIIRSFNVALDHQLWPTYGILLGLGFTFVYIFYPELSRDGFWWRLPTVTSSLWSVASVYYISAFLISFNLRPHNDKISLYNNFLYTISDIFLEIINWLLFPLIAIFLAVLPALDAHTRLMFGKYLEYWITEKK